MTVDELRAKIEAVLSLGDMLKIFIPGQIDDRIIEYARALSHCDEVLQLIVEDVFPADGPFMAAAGQTVEVTMANGTVQAMYRADADPGLHGACEWLLRTWKQEAWLKQVNDDWAKDRVKGEGWRAARADLAPSPPSPGERVGERGISLHPSLSPVPAIRSTDAR